METLNLAHGDDIEEGGSHTGTAPAPCLSGLPQDQESVGEEVAGVRIWSLNGHVGHKAVGPGFYALYLPR